MYVSKPSRTFIFRRYQAAPLCLAVDGVSLKAGPQEEEGSSAPRLAINSSTVMIEMAAGAPLL